jgi:hypothetical protein
MAFVKRLTVAATLGTAMLLGPGLSASSAHAGYIVTLAQQGSNVVAMGSGPIDVAGLTLTGSGTTSPAVITPSEGLIVTGPPIAITDIYLTNGPVTGPSMFGSGGAAFPTSGSGGLVGIFPLFIPSVSPQLIVPMGYVSGAPLSDSSTYDNQTFASLGVTPGTYEWTWGTGPNQNFTLDIPAVATPEPSSIMLLALSLGLVILLAARYRRGACGRHLPPLYPFRKP